MRLEGKVAIVTGAAKGIGAAIALRYSQEGASVVAVDVNADGVSETAAAINEAGGNAVAMTCDISDEAQVDATFASVMEKHGRVDVLVNNAGLISPMKHFLTADKAWWDKIISVNLTGTFLCCKAAAHIMAKQGSGSIINMSSGGATRAHRAFVAYDATKGGIEAMTRALALDLGPYGIRINAIVPGSIDTTGIDEGGRKMRGVNLPLGRIGEPADLTGAAVFLASDDSLYITGQCTIVDGGMLAQQRSATVDIMPPSDFPKID
ncbi:MAG: SDR family NAD(P)-dependent oxidoreductase [Chloroflexota bacterium]